MTDCFTGCFSFLGGNAKSASSSAPVPLSSQSSATNSGTNKDANGKEIKRQGSASESWNGGVSSMPKFYDTLPKRAKANGKVSGKVRISTDGGRSDPVRAFSLPQSLSDPISWFDEKLFLSLLEKLIKEAKYLQNNPKAGVTPQEERAAKIVVDALKPYTQPNGPLKVEVFTYVAKRPNVKITFAAGPAGCTNTVGFVGSHMDVVPANPEEWSHDPFKLTKVPTDDGSDLKLYGRGTTDCLGHVAMLTSLFIWLAKNIKTDEQKRKLNCNIVGVFIAAEEGGEFGVGVDCMMNDGKMTELKNGPVYWVDSADSQPCCGTNGVTQWELKATGRLFHSGLPHKGINSIELANEALSEIQRNFYKDFAACPEQRSYGFAAGSSMKPTQIQCSEGGLNQIPPWCKISGDIRLVPFYDMLECMDRIEGYVEAINKNVEALGQRGPYSRYTLPDCPEAEVTRGKVEISWGQDRQAAQLYEGIACDLTSDGHKALVQATAETRGEENCKPYSVSGSLPLVKMMQKEGFDLQMDDSIRPSQIPPKQGFGLMSTYHAVNEYCLLSDMRNATEILLRAVSLFSENGYKGRDSQWTR